MEFLTKKIKCTVSLVIAVNELSFFTKAATADGSKVDRGSKKGLKNGGIAAMFAAQTSQIKQQDSMDKKVWWIIFHFICRDIDILSCLSNLVIYCSVLFDL